MDLSIAPSIKDKIYTIRNLQVMLDSDLAELYAVETKMLNRAVKRNSARFPSHFMFQLTEKEADSLSSYFVASNSLRFQFGTSNMGKGGRRYLPYVFTEQGVSMLASVLRSTTAIKVSIQIMDAFVSMRSFIAENVALFARLDSLEQKQLITENNFKQVFNALESHVPKQGVFFDGQVFDAHTFVSDLVRSAKESIMLIDNYIDDSVLTLLSKRRMDVSVTVLTKYISKQLELDVKKHNKQYAPIMVKEFTKSHDRFLIIDKQVYHFGASLKDIGKKWCAFSKLDLADLKVLEESLY